MEIAERRLDRRHRLRRRPERVLVRSDLDRVGIPYSRSTSSIGFPGWYGTSEASQGGTRCWIDISLYLQTG